MDDRAGPYVPVVNPVIRHWYFRSQLERMVPRFAKGTLAAQEVCAACGRPKDTFDLAKMGDAFVCDACGAVTRLTDGVAIRTMHPKGDSSWRIIYKEKQMPKLSREQMRLGTEP